MRPLATFARADAAPIEGLFFDLDDTLLSHGTLTREAYSALWDLADAKIALVAVTGRPASWGDLAARQWPIDGAITENGAVYSHRVGRGMRMVFDGDEEAVQARRERLAALVAEVAFALPDVPLADDAGGRRADVAWNVSEGITIPEDRIAALVAMILRAGARVTRSSVHVHATYERDDKASGALRYLRERHGADVGRALYRWAFVGDSGNDAACFSAFHATFGVANVRAYVPALTVPPRWIATRERGAGFAEIAAHLLAMRG